MKDDNQSEELSFFLTNTEYVSVYFMTDDEIKESIIDDMLHLLIDKKYKSVSKRALYRFIKNDQFLVDYVSEIMNDLISIGLVEQISPSVYIIPKHRYRDAMEFCGCWYDGYEPPEGTQLFTISDEWKDIIALNGVEKAADYLAHQFFKSSELNNTSTSSIN